MPYLEALSGVRMNYPRRPKRCQTPAGTMPRRCPAGWKSALLVVDHIENIWGTSMPPGNSRSLLTVPAATFAGRSSNRSESTASRPGGQQRMEAAKLLLADRANLGDGHRAHF